MKKTIKDYEKDIIALHNELKEYPDSTTLQEKRSRKLTAWSKKLNIAVQVASNEQTDWQSEEIGYPCIPMITKQASGQRQVADYHAYLEDYNYLCGLCVERKGVTRKNGRMVSCDLYSSFAKKDNRNRFYREIQRFKQDHRFDTMILIAECSKGEYLTFKPSFNGNNYNRTNFGMNVAARRATIAKLEMMGVHVDFAGTRSEAVKSYRDLIIQWCRTRYTQILDI